MLLVLVIRKAVSGVRRMTQMYDHLEGMTKNPPMAMDVRIKLKPI
jgi:hypothetical protein